MKQTTVIGRNHGKNVSRIWIEGRRLVESGFVVGAKYRRRAVSNSKHFPNFIELRLDPNGNYKVSGKGERPIIDIAGKVVVDVFPTEPGNDKQQLVDVIYDQDIITITKPSE